MWCKPRDARFRAVHWRGDITELYPDWLQAGLITVTHDGTAVMHRTKQGPAVAAPDGQWWIHELPAEAGEMELYPVRADVHDAKYEPGGEVTDE